MWTWILIAALYALGMGFFSLLGGLRAAGDAFRRWGETASRERRLSPSS
jgi:hypothetical protein